MGVERKRISRRTRQSGRSLERISPDDQEITSFYCVSGLTTRLQPLLQRNVTERSEIQRAVTTQ